VSDKPDKDEKVHDPSASRLRKAKEDGNIFRSKEIASVGILMAGAAVILFGAGGAFTVLQEMTRAVFLEAPTQEMSITAVQGVLFRVGAAVGLVLGPLFAVLMVVSVVANAAQGGVHVTTKPLEPKLNRISPGSGFKRIFSTKSLFTLGKALVKGFVVGPLAYYTIKEILPEIVMLHAIPLEAAMAQAGGWIADLLIKIILALTALSVVDFAFEKYKWTADLKMTFKEVKDESKEQEGDPHIKGRRRQKARELAMGPRLVDAVLQADVVITNPTHYAIALQYDPLGTSAPRVLAKGLRKRAQTIKGMAAENEIPMVENRPLARALYAAVPEGEEIPEELYVAVAEILAEVFRQKGTLPRAL
jgi:flagellar biosynthetic protein FlhB